MFELIEIIHARHRTLALAEKHLRKLQREYPEPEFLVIIAARRNALGKFSATGSFWTFEIYQQTAKKKKRKKKTRKKKAKRKVKRKKLPKPKKKKKELPEPEDFEEDEDAEYGGAFDSP